MPKSFIAVQNAKLGRQCCTSAGSICAQVVFFLSCCICMALSVWFPTSKFHFNFQRLDDVAVRAYHATFHILAQLPASTSQKIHLCMLHHDEIGRFPYPAAVADSMAPNFANQHGLQLVGNVSYGYVCPRHSWHPHRCCHAHWIGWYCSHCRTQH